MHTAAHAQVPHMRTGAEGRRRVTRGLPVVDAPFFFSFLFVQGATVEAPKGPTKSALHWCVSTGVRVSPCVCVCVQGSVCACECACACACACVRACMCACWYACALAMVLLCPARPPARPSSI